MTQLLAGDIGGTKTILRLVEAQPTDGRAVATPETLYEATYTSADYEDLVPMVREFLTGNGGKPQGACFAIAGPVIDNRSSLTNLSWVLERDRLEAELNLERAALINDFEAVGYGVLGLQDGDLKPLQAGDRDPDAPIAIIGAGTGLGQGFVIPTEGGYRVFASEGGHADFAPRNELEFALLQYLIEDYQLPRVSVERVVSGMGIVAIYKFLCHHQQETPHFLQSDKDAAAAISKAASQKSDRLAEQTLELFVDAYGAEAGNLALKLLPRGGLYVAGGIAAKILPLMLEGDRFLNAFSHKGRVSPAIARVPIDVVLNPQVGLIGAAICAAGLFAD